MDGQRASPPSSPLSILSQSPSPPSSPLMMDPSKRYPSPSSTAQSGTASPIKLSDSPDEICVRTDGPPPPKRRRTQPPKPRTTEYLDLEDRDAEAEEQLGRLLKVLRKKKRIVVVAGAGISVSAGIPDFRSSTGLFTTLRGQHSLKGSGKHLFDASVYKHEHSTESFHKMVRELAHLSQTAQPTAFHHLLASLAHEGRLMRLYSQNVDCIDTSMAPLATKVPLNVKGPWPATIQLHGSLENTVCTKCGHLDAFDGSRFQGPHAPLCRECTVADQVRTSFAGKRSHGIGRLRPRMVLYNEENPDAEAIGNVSKADLRRVPDAVLVVGTTLKIPGVRRIVKELCLATRDRRDGFTAWINIDPEPQGVEFKDCWDLVVQGKCDDVAELARLPRWDEQDIGESWKVSGDPGQEGRCKDEVDRQGLAVVLDGKPPPKAAEAKAVKEEARETLERKPRFLGQVQAGMPTPNASPKIRTALPDKPVKGRTTQSKLFSLGAAATKAGAAKEATAAKNVKVVKPRKPRQAKKQAKPGSNLMHTFKTTKAAPAADTKTPQKQVRSGADSSDLSSPPDLLDYFPAALPPLRDSASSVRMQYRESRPLSSDSTFYAASSPPRHRRTSSTVTISPDSKPRGMCGLID